MTGCATTGNAPAGTGTTTTTAAGAAQGELSQQQLEQIYNDSIMNQANLNTYKFDMDMDMLTNVTGGSEAGKMTMLTKSSGAANLASNQMQMTMEMDVSMEGLGYEDSSQSLTYDVYQMADWTYMRMEIPGAGEQWVKMPTSEKIDEQLNFVDQQLGPLESAVDIELQGYANVDGVECYVLSLVPDMEELTKWISAQQGAVQDIDWGDIPNLSDIFKKLEYTCYITKDSNLLKKLVVNMQMELTPELMGEGGDSFDRMFMNISVDMTLYDYNEPFSINLPDEAENATQVSEDMFL
jgi:hypothetical protein